MKQMRWMWLLCPLMTALANIAAAQSTTQPSSNALNDFYNKVRPGLVAVKYQWVSELGKQEIIGCGVVVRADGLVMIPLPLVSQYLPDEQMKDFKILVPDDVNDAAEIDATLLGRDERSDVGFVQAKGKHDWTVIHFQSLPLTVGQTVYGVGLLPKFAGYKPYLTQSIVSANLRGEVPQVMVSGGLGNVGSPVFDDQLRAVGIVIPQEGQEMLLDGRSEMSTITSPPKIFAMSKFFLDSLSDPPSAEHPIVIPWMGVPEMTGVSKQLADFLGLKDQPAVQLGDVVPGAPAAAAGLTPGNIIIAMNGAPLERGDLPEELPMILRRHLMRLKVGDKVTFTILPQDGSGKHDVTLTLSPRPRIASQAKRYYAKDLGFVAREAVFTDAYEHKMKPDATGVVIDLTRRDGAAATAKLGRDDWVMQLNGQPVTTLDQFHSDYDAFRRDHAHDEVVLVVQRMTGQEETVNIEPPQTDAAPGAGAAEQP